MEDVNQEPVIEGAGQNQPGEEAFHFFLISGEVTYKTKKLNKVETHTVKLNCMARSGMMGFNAHQLGLAQQTLIARLHKEVIGTDKNAKVTDVFISGVSFLGLMTENEFNPPVKQPFMEVAE